MTREMERVRAKVAALVAASSQMRVRVHYAMLPDDYPLKSCRLHWHLPIVAQNITEELNVRASLIYGWIIDEAFDLRPTPSAEEAVKRGIVGRI